MAIIIYSTEQFNQWERPGIIINSTCANNGHFKMAFFDVTQNFQEFEITSFFGSFSAVGCNMR